MHKDVHQQMGDLVRVVKLKQGFDGVEMMGRGGVVFVCLGREVVGRGRWKRT